MWINLDVYPPASWAGNSGELQGMADNCACTGTGPIPLSEEAFEVMQMSASGSYK